MCVCVCAYLCVVLQDFDIRLLNHLTKFLKEAGNAGMKHLDHLSRCRFPPKR